ncbi:MAG: hypothetical protein JWQ81_3208 [Amycolatopsis sp.]|uniref:hypothetical protein n=1 Tax=Amycolatopsis sp. TaxID=37632 RepID=UPI00261F53F6|nr:hypothetical protein [Amycolatopsis sp.]MCU1682469.1 hypothetical protein [Amycolatopsis sp.]
MSDDNTTNPFMTATARETADKIEQGYASIFLHEWSELGNKTSPDVWRETVQAACEESGVPCEFRVIASKSLTLVFNPTHKPSEREIDEAIASLLEFREVERQSQVTPRC